MSNEPPVQSKTVHKRELKYSYGIHTTFTVPGLFQKTSILKEISTLKAKVMNA